VEEGPGLVTGFFLAVYLDDVGIGIQQRTEVHRELVQSGTYHQDHIGWLYELNSCLMAESSGDTQIAVCLGEDSTDQKRGRGQRTEPARHIAENPVRHRQAVLRGRKE
jgi:hypothetical protein